MKTKRIKRPVCYLVGLLAFGLMLYSCLQDETDLDSQETTGKIIKGKNRELSIDVARSWYEAHQTPVVTTRSVVTHFELMTKLHWKKGYENRKGKFEVVEVPLLTRGGAVLMDSETMEKCKDTERGKIRNISRMVIIKNLESGEIINFVMHIVGTYDYLMKAKHFEDNSYLYRAPDLSGSVYFYEPEGSLVNGWQYEDGKIVATISQGTEEGSRMQDTIDTRGMVLKPVCHTESVYMEHNECNGFTYQDPEYGLSFGSECRKVGTWEKVQVCIETPTYEEDSNIGGQWDPNENTSGGGGGGYQPQPIAPKAKEIFRNSSMTKENWKVIEEKLEKITKSCMGKALYNGLKESLKGKTLAIQFTKDKNSSFDLNGSGIRLTTASTSGDFFHEMLHAYQSYRETYDSMSSAKLNMEIETHYAQYLYQSSLPEYTSDSYWKKRDMQHLRWKAIANLNNLIDRKGNLQPNTKLYNLELELLNVVIPALQSNGYPESKYTLDLGRVGIVNFENIRELTRNC